MKRALAVLILLDVAQTHIAVGHLDAQEVLLFFVNSGYLAGRGCKNARHTVRRQDEKNLRVG